LVGRIPKVTIRPARAAATAPSSAACSTGKSAMAWSAASNHSTASGSVWRSNTAAAAMAGALLRATGSSRMRASAIFASRSCSATRKRCASLHTTTGGPKPGPTARDAVSWSMVRAAPPSSGQNCFG
jgi:hypothetical protein